MIAKYNSQYFCCDLTVAPVNIWRYDCVEGFDKKTTRRGTIYYEKFVDISELDEIFDVGFSVKWNEHWCGANPSRDGYTVSLLLGWNDGSFARGHNFSELEYDRGMVVAWGLNVNIDECEECRITIEYEYPIKEVHQNIVPKEEWLDMYQKTVRELIPQNLIKVDYEQSNFKNQFLSE